MSHRLEVSSCATAELQGSEGVYACPFFRPGVGLCTHPVTGPRLLTFRERPRAGAEGPPPWCPLRHAETRVSGPSNDEEHGP